MLNSGQGSVMHHFQLDVTVPAKSMTKPLTDFRTGHRTVSFRMTSTVTGFFFAVSVDVRREEKMMDDGDGLG